MEQAKFISEIRDPAEFRDNDSSGWLVHMYYFSYGSNMSIRRFRLRVPSAACIGSGILKGHELRFHKVSSRDGSAKCDVVVTASPDQVAYVWCIGSMKRKSQALTGRRPGFRLCTEIRVDRDGERRRSSGILLFCNGNRPSFEAIRLVPGTCVERCKGKLICRRRIFTVSKRPKP